MSKIRIYLQPGRITDVVKIGDKTLIHKIKNVLRLASADIIYIFDGLGKEYTYRIENIKKNTLSLKQESILRVSNQRDSKVTLAFPIEKEERVDFILQKATEFGVSDFLPFSSQRSLRQKVSPQRLKRWQRIIVEAVRQSERLWIPGIREVSTFKAIAESDYRIKLAGSIKGQAFEKVLNKEHSNILFIVGPVGDFSLQEFGILEENQFKLVKLASQVLRVETAAIFAVGFLNYFFLNNES